MSIPQGPRCWKWTIHPVKQPKPPTLSFLFFNQFAIHKRHFLNTCGNWVSLLVKGFLKIQIYYILCILLIHVLTETTGLQQVSEAEFPVVEVMLILDSFCVLSDLTLYYRAYPLTRNRRMWEQLMIPERLKDLYNFFVNHVMHMFFVICLWNTDF